MSKRSKTIIAVVGILCSSVIAGYFSLKDTIFNGLDFYTILSFVFGLFLVIDYEKDHKDEEIEFEEEDEEIEFEEEEEKIEFEEEDEEIEFEEKDEEIEFEEEEWI